MEWKPKIHESNKPVIDFATDSIRALELQEMQEEEKYIQALRSQREKVELFKNEVIKKDLKIRELEKTLKEFKYTPQKVKEIEEELKFLNRELQEKEQENYDLRQKIRKQVEEYESSLKEVQLIVFREREEKNCEIKTLKKRLLDQEDLKTLQSKIRDLEEKLEYEQKQNKEKDKISTENIKTWKNLEKMLKDQVTDLSAEKYTLSSKYENLLSENSKILTKIEKLEKNLESQNEEKKTKELLFSFEQKEKELLLTNSKLKSENYELNEEINSLQEELNKALEIITRQDSSISDLRNKNQDTLMIYEELQNENENLEKDFFIVKKNLIEKETELNKTFVELNNARAEYEELNKKMNKIVEKENLDKAERQKHAKLKIELMNQRAFEVNRLAEAIQAFSTESKYNPND